LIECYFSHIAVDLLWKQTILFDLLLKHALLLVRFFPREIVFMKSLLQQFHVMITIFSTIASGDEKRVMVVLTSFVVKEDIPAKSSFAGD